MKGEVMANNVQERKLKWYGRVMSREEKGAVEMKVQGRRNIGRPKRSCLDRVRDDIKEGVLGGGLYNHVTWRCMSSHIELYPT